MPRPRFNAVRVLSLIGVVLVLIGLMAAPLATAAVVLNYFDVFWDTDLETINISWETATEFDTSGFTVERASSPTGTYTQVGEFEPAVGDQIAGATYGPFFDIDAVTGTTYWYRLVVWDRNNNPDRTIPIVAVIAGNKDTPTPTNTPVTPSGAVPATDTHTPTPTSTGTRTRTPTATPTLLFTHTPTLGPSPTRTATVPAGATVTPIVRSTVTSALTPTPLPISVNATAAATERSVPATPTPLPPLSQPGTEIAQTSPLATPTPRPTIPAPTLVPTDATFVPIAPVVIATPVETPDAANLDSGSGGILTLVGAAGLLLLGGLYLILRQTSK